MHHIKNILAVSLVCLSASAVSAQVTFSLTAVPIPAGTQIVDGLILPAGTPGPVLGTLDGYVCQDLSVDTANDWTAGVLLIELTAGSIYQELEGIVPVEGGAKFYNGWSSQQPLAAYIPVMPSSEYDTYVHGNGQSATFHGGGGDIGGDVQQFDSTEIDVTWSGPSWVKDDIGTSFIGRITLTSDAAGTWKLKVTQADDYNSIYVVTGTITNGVMSFDP